MLVEIMHVLSSSLQGPVIVVLIALVATMVLIVGMLIAEAFTERRYFTLSVPDLVDSIRASGDAGQAILDSGMLRRQKNALLELLKHPSATEAERESMAVDIVAREQAIYDNRVKITDLIAKVAPMLGLMGTLIPLGPGIVGIGEGDTMALSESLTVAFDTTVLGLVVAAVALCVSTIRKAWYAKYASSFEAACECVLEAANGGTTVDASLVAGPRNASQEPAVSGRVSAHTRADEVRSHKAPDPAHGEVQGGAR